MHILPNLRLMINLISGVLQNGLSVGMKNGRMENHFDLDGVKN